MPDEQTNLPRHLGYLDAARGIAAIMVLVGHFMCWKYDRLPVVLGLNFVFNAADAVSFFFVLSGMVLTYQYVVLGKSLELRTYYINRVFRLLPAFFVAVLLNALYSQRQLPVSEGLLNFLSDKNEFWEEAILVKSHVNYFVPGWTLTVELAMSFFIPFLVVTGKADRRLLPVLAVLSLLLYRVLDLFAFHFVLGCILSFWYVPLTSATVEQHRWYRFRHLALLAAIVLFSARRIDALFPAGGKLSYWAGYFQLSMFHYSAIGAFVILAFLLRSPAAQRFLSAGILQFFGRISYGIYLMHWLVVRIIFDNWDTIVTWFPGLRVAFVTMLSVCFAVTLLLATMLHYWVELPFIRWGKRYTGRLKPWLVIK